MAFLCIKGGSDPFPRHCTGLQHQESSDLKGDQGVDQWRSMLEHRLPRIFRPVTPLFRRGPRSGHAPGPVPCRRKSGPGRWALSTAGRRRSSSGVGPFGHDDTGRVPPRGLSSLGPLGRSRRRRRRLTMFYLSKCVLRKT